MKSPVLTDLVHIIHIIIIQTISGEITSSDRPGTQSYISELYRTYLVKSPVLTDLIHNHTSIIETISGEITSSDWPDTQSYINYRDHIWWNHQFWRTWYTLYISELYISGEITSSHWPGTQSYISELYRTYLVKSPVLTDLIHNHTSIIETLSGGITSSDRSGTHYTYHNYTDHIWWNHQFWPTWYTIIHQL